MSGKIKGTLERSAIYKLTANMLAQSRVIAKGRRIRDIRRLIETYGGKSSKWVKKSSPIFEIAGLDYEYHWYEHPGIGRVERKRKGLCASTWIAGKKGLCLSESR
ncbi:MAG: hypothetical protein DRI57_27900 [Deltaproteobacteria bacterium]|nr:MAG: hypothetical protein DRI57_27900 [Deltaproteobacteria bacterium]